MHICLSGENFIISEKNNDTCIYRQMLQLFYISY